MLLIPRTEEQLSRGLGISELWPQTLRRGLACSFSQVPLGMKRSPGLVWVHVDEVELNTTVGNLKFLP